VPPPLHSTTPPVTHTRGTTSSTANAGVPAPVDNRRTLEQFGAYVAQMLPKYVQAAQVTHVDELELMIAPSAVVPVMTFLKVRVCVRVLVRERILCLCLYHLFVSVSVSGSVSMSMITRCIIVRCVSARVVQLVVDAATPRHVYDLISQPTHALTRTHTHACTRTHAHAVPQ
jgi:hypothetical protein